MLPVAAAAEESLPVPVMAVAVVARAPLQSPAAPETSPFANEPAEGRGARRRGGDTQSRSFTEEFDDRPVNLDELSRFMRVVIISLSVVGSLSVLAVVVCFLCICVI